MEPTEPTIIASERRQHRRYPVSASQRRAILTAAGRKLRVSMTDVSLGGFGVWTRSRIGTCPGRIMVLDTVDERHQVRIVNVQAEHEGTRLGLQRLRDLPDALHSQAYALCVSAGRRIWQWCSRCPVEVWLLTAGFLYLTVYCLL